jgi:hypothetical protein
LLKKYLDEIYIYGSEILAFGQAAIDPLIKKLNDPENGHLAPGLLANINHPTRAVISALRKGCDAFLRSVLLAKRLPVGA